MDEKEIAVKALGTVFRLLRSESQRENPREEFKREAQQAPEWEKPKPQRVAVVGNQPHPPLRREESPALASTAETIEVSNDEIVAYQKREIGKELLVLEKHLQQGCKINGKGCDCCMKHPLALDALADETIGMTAEPVYNELKNWIKEINPKVTAKSSSSGRYDNEYPRMAVRAREFRKKILGTENLSAMLNEAEMKRVLEKMRNAQP